MTFTELMAGSAITASTAWSAPTFGQRAEKRAYRRALRRSWDGFTSKLHCLAVPRGREPGSSPNSGLVSEGGSDHEAVEVDTGNDDPFIVIIAIATRIHARDPTSLAILGEGIGRRRSCLHDEVDGYLIFCRQRGYAGLSGNANVDK